MGVPKFFRYISERYPCLSELLRENQVPEFDNLYLDMNGIIHNCSHPNDADVTFRISEEMIFEGVFHYVEYLFKMIRPQKLFFIAIDGVAPRAKMNQQRGRRFRSAYDAQQQLEKAIEKGEELPSGERFDSNCITPGTAFMVRLQKALEHFIQVKIATDVLWKACTVILSGHETPGEGEHKIMEYIRHAKAQPGFNPNTRHCLYGLDADLIMLGLCTHERYFSLLREEVKFGKNDKKTTVLKDIRFYLLHLTLLSEYLELEFASIRDKLRFPFDIHKLIDDWILLLYLVGNDFIPHLPHLHINENALPTMYRAYMDVLPGMDGYINEGGILNLPRLQTFMQRLAAFDREVFLERYTDLKYLEGKCGKDNLEAFDVSAAELIGSSDVDKDLMALIMSSEMLDSEGEEGEPIVSLDDIENDPELFEREFQSYKRNYYMTKMGYADFTEDVRAEQAECYVRALQWTLHYYYRGVVSWSWYYPHHYAPFISDVDNFAHLQLKFELASPFLPFQQLLSVLPAASKAHLPTAYHDLMTNPNSPVYDFYPPQFDTDLNGKQQAWEAVVLIPFIDEKRLLKAMHPCDAFLTDEEKKRNIHGPMLRYQYDAKATGPLEAKYGFVRIDQLPVSRLDIYRSDLVVEEKRLVLGPSKGAILDGYAKGFPTFKHLSYSGVLKEARVKIFNFPSKNDSMVIFLDRQGEQSPLVDTATLAKQLLGKIVYVSWPHLLEARVVRVSDCKQTYELNSNEAKQTDERSFSSYCRAIIEHNQNRLALNVGPIKQLVQVRTCVGTEYILQDNGFVLNRLWNTVDMAYPAQTIVTDLQDVMKQQKPYLEIHEMFPLDSMVFLRTSEFYGSKGQVAEISSVNKRVQARFLVCDEPDLHRVFQVHRQSLQNYRNVNDTAATLGISAHLLLQLTGTILVAHGGHRSLNVDDEKTVNIGLRLRMISRDEEAVGYCRKINKTWMFSDKTVQLLQAYADRMPGLFERIESNRRQKVCFETDLFGEGNEGKLQELCDWLKEQDHMNVERRSCGIELLEERAVETLAQLVDQYRVAQKPVVQTMFVDPKDLYRPGMKKAKTIDEMVSFEMLDRVVVVQDMEDAPVGWRGTIIGIHRVTDPNPVRREVVGLEDNYFEVLFDEPISKAVSIYNLPATEKRVLRLSQGALLNISGGRAMYGNRYKMPVNVDSTVGAMKPKKMANGVAHPQTWRSKAPNTSKATESIQRRVNEQIEKRNKIRNTNNLASGGDMISSFKAPPSSAADPGRGSVPQHRGGGSAEPAAAPMEQTKNDDEQVRKVEFERLWKKLKESSKTAPTLFDESDIKSFAQAVRGPGGGDGERQRDSKGAKTHHRPTTSSENHRNSVNQQHQTVKVGEVDIKVPTDGQVDIINVLMSQMSSGRAGDGKVENSDTPARPSDSKLKKVEVPSPASLPKPPIQWQRSNEHAAPSSHPSMHSAGGNTKLEEKVSVRPSSGVTAPVTDGIDPSAFIAHYGSVQRQSLPPPMRFGDYAAPHRQQQQQQPQPQPHPHQHPGGAQLFCTRPAMMHPPNAGYMQQQQLRPLYAGPPSAVVPPQLPGPYFGGFWQPPQSQQLQQHYAPLPPPPMQQQQPIEVTTSFADFLRQQQQSQAILTEPPPPMAMPQGNATGLGPKGPQNLSYNRNNPAGKGAFVPLQAMKQNVKSKPMSSGHNGSVAKGNNTGGMLNNQAPGNKVQGGGRQDGSGKAFSGNPVPPAGNSFTEKNARERQGVGKQQAEANKDFVEFLSSNESTNHGSKEDATETIESAQQISTRQKDKQQHAQKEHSPVAVKKKTTLKQKNRIAARFGSAPDG